VSSRVVPGTGAPGCTGVRLHAVGRRTCVLGARSVHHPVSSPSSVRSGRCLELRVSPPGATRILPSGLSPSVPEFHRLTRWSLGCLTLPWHERVADCDRRFGLSPTPEHDVDTDYATAHAGGLICFLWDNFRDKMTFYDCTLSAFSSPSQQALAAATRGTVLKPDSSTFGNDLSRFHNGGECQTDQRVMRASRGLLRAH